MEKSRLYELFQCLDNQQLRDLKKVVKAPIYNKRKDVILLFEHLVQLRKKKRADYSKQLAFQKMYDSSDYDDGRMRLVMTLLHQLIDRYLVQQSLSEDAFQSNIRLLKIYRKLNLPRHFESLSQRMAAQQTKQAFRNADYYDAAFQFNEERYRYAATNRRFGEFYLDETIQHLNVAYIARQLRQASFSISHQAIYKKELQVGLVAEMLRYVETENLITYPVVGIYYHYLMAVQHVEEFKYFEALKNMLVKHGILFPEEERRELYRLTLNFCIRQYNAGDGRYLKEELEIYQVGLEKGYLLTAKGYLSRFSYRNIVTLCLAIGALEWGRSFIQEYHQELAPEYRESMYSFNLARMEFRQKHYQKALILLQKSEFKELLINLSAKTVMAKIFFELNELDVLDAHLLAMKNFIYRKKVIGYHRENYLNFLRFLPKVIEVIRMDQNGKEKLRQEIKSTKAIAERDWLLQQL